MKPLIFDWKNKKAKKLINSEKKIEELSLQKI